MAEKSVAEALRESVAIFALTRYPDDELRRGVVWPAMSAAPVHPVPAAPSASSHDAMALRAGGCVDAWLTAGRRTLDDEERRHRAFVKELRGMLQARLPADVVPLILTRGGWDRTPSLFDRAAKLRAWADNLTTTPVYWGMLDQRKRAALVRLYAATEADAAAYADVCANVGSGRTPLGDARYIARRRGARRVPGAESSNDGA